MPHALEYLAVALLVLSEAAGGFSLVRLAPDLEVGPLGMARTWLVAFFALSVLLAWTKTPVWRAPVLRVGGTVALLHIGLLLSLWWSPGPLPDTVEIVNVVLLIVGMPLAAVLFVQESENRQRWMLKLLFLLGLAVLPVAVLAFSGVTSELSLRSMGSIRIARTAGLGAIAGLALASQSRQWRWVIPVPLWVLAMLASGNRASLLALVAGGLFLLRGMRTRRVIGTTALMAAVAAGIVLTVPIAGDIVRFFFQQAIWDADGRVYLADRGILFQSAWRLFSSAPWIGQGFGGFEALSGIYYAYPHNLTLSFAAEMGLLGLVPFAALVATAVLAVFRSRTAVHRGMGGIFAYLLVSTQFSGSYGDAFLMWVVALALCGGADEETAAYRTAVT